MTDWAKPDLYRFIGVLIGDTGRMIEALSNESITHSETGGRCMDDGHREAWAREIGYAAGLLEAAQMLRRKTLEWGAWRP